VDGALSSVQAERDAANAALLAKDAELRTVTRERDAIKDELPRLAAQVAQAEQKAEAIKTQVATKIDEVKAVANTFDAERRKAGLPSDSEEDW
jgi:predicted  nucleic acid-binding Zn-ribbon protein